MSGKVREVTTLRITCKHGIPRKMSDLMGLDGKRISREVNFPLQTTHMSLRSHHKCSARQGFSLKRLEFMRNKFHFSLQTQAFAGLAFNFSNIFHHLLTVLKDVQPKVHGRCAPKLDVMDGMSDDLIRYPTNVRVQDHRINSAIGRAHYARKGDLSVESHAQDLELNHDNLMMRTEQ